MVLSSLALGKTRRVWVCVEYPQRGRHPTAVRRQILKSTFNIGTNVHGLPQEARPLYLQVSEPRKHIRVFAPRVLQVVLEASDGMVPGFFVFPHGLDVRKRQRLMSAKRHDTAVVLFS